jgi:hypothetical protein
MQIETAHKDDEKGLLHDERSQQRDRASVKKNVTRILGLESSKDGIEHRRTSLYLLSLQEMGIMTLAKRRACHLKRRRRGPREAGDGGRAPHRGGIERRNKS